MFKKRASTLRNVLFTFILLFYSLSSLATSLTFVAEDLPPYHFKNSEGEVVGALVDISEAVLKTAHLTGKFEIMPMARAFHEFETHPNTIMMSLLKNPSRANQFQWLGKIYFADAYLVSLNDFKYSIPSLQAAKAYRVSTIRGYSSEHYLRAAGYDEDDNLILVSHYFQLWNMLYKGRIDFVLTNTLTLQNELKQAGLDPSRVKKHVHLTDYPSTLYLAGHKELDKKKAAAIKVAIEQVKESGQYQEILKKWQLPEPEKQIATEQPYLNIVK